jgi:hypothetical protein
LTTTKTRLLKLRRRRSIVTQSTESLKMTKKTLLQLLQVTTADQSQDQDQLPTQSMMVTPRRLKRKNSTTICEES